MTRPAYTTVSHGQSSSDSTINNNFALIFDAPAPFYVAATVAALLAQAPGSYTNCFAFTADTKEIWQSDGTNWRHYGPGHVNASGARGLLKVATTELTALSGPTATWAGAFPAGCTMLGVSLYVTTLVTGATSFDVGDGTDVDRFAAAAALAAGTTKTPADHTATPLEWTATAKDVVLTANGSDFTAGAVRLVAYYLQLTAPTA